MKIILITKLVRNKSFIQVDIQTDRYDNFNIVCLKGFTTVNYFAFYNKLIKNLTPKLISYLKSRGIILNM